MKIIVVGFSMSPNDKHRISIINITDDEVNRTKYFFESDMDYEDIAYIAYILYNELNFSTDEFVLITSEDLEGLYELTKQISEFEKETSERGITKWNF